MIANKSVIDATEALAHDRVEIGAKAANLARLLAADFPVPRFVVLKAPAAVALEQLEFYLPQLTRGGCLLAVRSSSPEEDGVAGSFAGLLESHLNVALHELPGRIDQVRQSARAPHVLNYRECRGLTGPPPPCAVIVQTLLAPSVSGVAFGADPVTGSRGVCVVTAVAGSAIELVDGSVDGQMWRIDEDATIVARPAADGGTPLLTDAQVRAVGRLTHRAGLLLGGPQDVEWAIESDKLWLVQSRPITSLPPLRLEHEHTGTRRVWDNANISESYGGITTPLTFSFARSVYEGVYRAFCRLMGVSRARIEANDDLFAQMLGLFRGRVYYSLFNWYRLIALLPGYASNRRFMEQMMGVREPMPDEIVGDLAHLDWRGRLRDRADFAISVAHLAVRYAMLDRMARRFDARLDQTLASPTHELQTLALDALATEYRRLERALLNRWDAPLVNDFFTMICFGVLRTLAERWGGPQGWGHIGQLLGGGTEMLTVEPARRIAAMGEAAAAIDGAAEIFCEANAAGVAKLLDQQPELRASVNEHIARFGDRCMEELKLETATLHEDPAVLWRAIGRSAMRVRDGEAGRDDASRHWATARHALNQATRRRPLRRVIMNTLIRRARRHLTLRENLRFQRTRVFGRVRRLVTQMGRQLAAAGRLDQPADVFYLEIDELLGFVEGGITCPDLRSVANARRATFAQYAEQPPPPERFETFGEAHFDVPFEQRATLAVDPRAVESRMQGVGCYPGIVSAIARRVHDPRIAQPAPGHILVAERTDPGWVMLFPGAAGVLVQRGSVLSHSATLAREMGIPTIVGIAGLMEGIQDGDLVEMDGAAGTVSVVTRGCGGSAPTNRRSAG